MINLYDILQVSENASKEIIEKSYRALAKKYHPDIAVDKVKAEERMKDINVAYDTLSDSIKREEYDNQLKNERQSQVKEAQTTQQSNVTSHKYYKNSNYDGYHPNHENFNFFEKITHLDNETKKLLVIAIIFIIAVSISLYFYITDFIDTYSIADDIANNNSQRVEIEDDRPKAMVQEYLDNILLENSTKYILKDSIEYDFNIFSNNQFNTQINDKLLSNTTIRILDDKVYETEAIVEIEIARIDVSYAFGRYYMNFWTQQKEEFSEEEKYRLFSEALDENIDKIDIYNDKIYLERIDGEWKINLKESNIIKLYGFSVNKKI